MKIERNPPDRRDRYLTCLNVSYGSWGDEQTWNWAFERDVDGRRADLMVVTEDDGDWLAGSAISWRPLQLPDGRRTLAGIMTGSWSLPEARGRGCFTAMIGESRRWVAEAGGGVLLAFVTEGNASRRRLESAGSTMFPTRYAFSVPATPLVPRAPVLEPIERPDDALLADIHRRLELRGRGFAFMTLSARDWAGQLVERPGETRVLECGELGHAIVEYHGDTVRVQALAALGPEQEPELIRAILRHSQRTGRKFFCFVSDPGGQRDPSADLGLDGISGFIAALPAAVPSAPEPASLAPWFVQSGDRM